VSRCSSITGWASERKLCPQPNWAGGTPLALAQRSSGGNRAEVDVMHVGHQIHPTPRAAGGCLVASDAEGSDALACRFRMVDERVAVALACVEGGVAVSFPRGDWVSRESLFPYPRPDEIRGWIFAAGKIVHFVLKSRFSRTRNSRRRRTGGVTDPRRPLTLAVYLLTARH
jgi:hypothetical protein